MCGRYASTSSSKELQSFFDTMQTVGDALPPSYNVAPTQPVRVILERTPREEPDAEPQRQLRTVQWGLLPAWSKDRKMASKLINARSETVTEKPSFRSSASKRRAIIPANGYYEWMKSEAGSKIPYFLHSEDDILAMAGLYELWPDPELPEDDPNKWVWTCTVLTRPATDATGHIHDRSPLILLESFWEHWLDPNLTDKGEVQAMINSVPEPHLEPYEVSTAVNSPRNNDPSLLEPVARPA